MVDCAGIRIDHWTCRVWHDRCWLQGQVGRGIPRVVAVNIQRLHQQLVERAFSAPPTRFP